MWTYARIDELSGRLASCLASLGAGPGVSVAVHLRNGYEYVVAEFAILKLAAIRVPLNELMGVPELGYCLEHSGARILITDADLPKAVTAPADLVQILVGGAPGQALAPGQVSWAEALNGQGPIEPRTALPEDTAIIAYTGGTTGRPKGVRHTYGRMAWNLFSHINCLDIRAEEVMMHLELNPKNPGWVCRGSADILRVRRSMIPNAVRAFRPDLRTCRGTPAGPRPSTSPGCSTWSGPSGCSPSRSRGGSPAPRRATT